MTRLKSFRAGLLADLSRVLIQLLLISLVSFILIEQLGPDQAFEQLGRHGSSEQLESIRRAGSSSDPILSRYVLAMNWLWSEQPLESNLSGQRVLPAMRTALGVSCLALLPGILIGQFLALGLALLAVRHENKGVDRLISTVALIIMSTSVVILMLGLRTLLSSEDALGYLAVSGWSTTSLAGYLHHAMLPTLIMLIVQLGYSLMIYRSLIQSARHATHVDYLLACGQSRWRVLIGTCLPDCGLVIATRFLYALPGLLIAGGLVIEQHLQIPGLGSLIYPALLSGDIAILMPLILCHALYFQIIRSWLRAWQRRKQHPLSAEGWIRVSV